MSNKKMIKEEKVSQISRGKKARGTHDTRDTRGVSQKGLTIDVFNTTGKVVEKVILPKEVFGVKVNKPLMAQAVRVYLANQRRGTSSTKTRGEVEGSTRKIYRQKGTGRARHGAVRAPIFVKGGIAFGPKPRDYSLTLPQKMRRAALASALSAKLNEGEVKVLTGLEKVAPKTKEITTVLASFSPSPKKSSILLVLPEKLENVIRAARNIAGLQYIYTHQLNTYEVLRSNVVLFMKDAIIQLSEKEKSA